MKDKNIIITSLNEGMIVKNYKEMCKLLNQSPTTGEARQNQIKNWERYFSFERNGQKIIVKEIFDTPIPLPEKPKKVKTKSVVKKENIKTKIKKGGKYLGDGEIILKYLLTQKGETPYFITKSQLIKDLGLVNELYQNCTLSCIQKELNNQNISNQHLINCYKICNSQFYQFINRLLNSLEKRGIINCSKVCIALYRNIDTNQIEEISLNNSQYINKLEKLNAKVLDIMNFKNIEEVYKHMKWRYFYNLRSKIGRLDYGWINVYDKYCITLASDIIEVPTEQEYIEHKKLLNEKMYNRLIQTGTQLINKQHQKSNIQTKEYNDRAALNCKIGQYIPQSKEELQNKRLIFDYEDEFENIFIELVKYWTNINKK